MESLSSQFRTWRRTKLLVPLCLNAASVGPSRNVLASGTTVPQASNQVAYRILRLGVILIDEPGTQTGPGLHLIDVSTEASEAVPLLIVP
jgi:hypothetical protein